MRQCRIDAEEIKLTAVYLGLGSNLGNRKANITAALQRLTAVPEITLVRQASYYETEPVGYQDQDWFLNTVALFETALLPLELLQQMQQIELALGRVRTIRWGPRTIDIDLLFYGEQIINTPELIVPHPRILERAFVVVPLLEIAPDLQYPGKGKINTLVAPVVEEQRISRL